MTMSAEEARELALTTGPVSSEAAQKVLDYLVFHRSLLGENDHGTPALLGRYMELVRGLKEGVHIVIADPFQKATALLFELVMEESFDPWEIDLARFTQLYLDRVREDRVVDFAVAGRLLFMAWSILLLQSREVLRHRDPPVEAPLPDADGSEALPGYLSEVDSPEALDVTSAVVDGVDAPPLVGMVRHPGSRPVSLLELVRAFDDAEAEARRALRIQELRDRLREEQHAPPEVIVHGDLPERDLADVWEVARRHPVGEPFPLLDMWRPEEGRDRLVSTFLATLFLTRERSVDLQQERPAVDPILVVRLTDARAAVAEE